MIFAQGEIKKWSVVIVAVFLFHNLQAQEEAYFIDGYHGGIWGHYPEKYTSYIVDELDKNEEWSINLEIEPETWDRAARIDANSVSKLKDYIAQDRVEYVNPAYGQPYMWNISGESIIRQLEMGMHKVREHFPEVTFTTYSSEEPCFTSALPQILSSFGFKYASLKNPNTCWGGYTREHEGELVSWTGSDGSTILTVPRYSFEELLPGSTWETTANANSPAFIQAAFDHDFKAPIGMCLQDAGWKNGPWLKGNYYKPTAYTTWSNYFENIAQIDEVQPWHFNQEDVQVSLVWGSQVLQRIAQRERKAANKIILAEKIAALHDFENMATFPEKEINEAWRTLLLTQHHDCWIVPYNGDRGDTWADKVEDWTTTTISTSDDIIASPASKDIKYIKVYNTSGKAREGWTQTTLPKSKKAYQIQDLQGNIIPSQQAGNTLFFKATAPALGFATYKVKTAAKTTAGARGIMKDKNGLFTINTSIYTLQLDAAQGGKIVSLLAKKLDNKEFVDSNSKYGFNTLRGNFHDEGGLKTTLNNPAEITILENGPYHYKLAIHTSIAGTPVTQTISVFDDSPRIDFNLDIDWKKNTGIGAFKEKGLKASDRVKAFYNDEQKLLSLFPLNLEGQKVFKNSAFDVMESGLENTFFESWDAIKNNIIVDWVDVTDADEAYGMALFSDHTTSYTHGKDFPLGLTVQYSGAGLWGRNYSIEGPTSINYTLLPHRGNWQEAGLWQHLQDQNEPLTAVGIRLSPKATQKSLLEIKKKGWILTSFTKKGDAYYARVFNAESDATEASIILDTKIENASLVNLDGSLEQALNIEDTKNKSVSFSIPQMGFKTIKLKLTTQK